MTFLYKFYNKFIKTFKIKKLFYLFLILLFLPILLFILLIKPMFFIRFGNLGCERIGNFLAAELYLLNNKFEKKRSKSFDIWIVGESLCNNQLLVMLKRKFFVVNHLSFFWRILKLLSKYTDIFSQHIIISENDLDTKNLLDKYPAHLKLTKEEIIKGESIFNQFKIPKKAKIVCLTIRDNSYLRVNNSSKNFSYHNYRDSDARNYIPVIKYLIERDYFVVRMGKTVSKKINIKSKKFIDYPFHPIKSDFMDFFFAHKCHFWIGTNAGLDQLADVFRKPMLVINMAPFGRLKMTRKKKILVSKTHINSKGKKLSINEIFKAGAANLDKSTDFRRKNIKLLEAKPNEIKEYVFEIIQLIGNLWIQKKSDFNLQNKFRKLYTQNIKKNNFSFLHGKLLSFYSASFLKKNKWFLK